MSNLLPLNTERHQSRTLMAWLAQRPDGLQRAAVQPLPEPLPQNAGNGATFYTSSDPRVIDLLGGAPAASGMYVGPDTAMRVAAVYACVSRIAGGVSTLPLLVYERTWDAERFEYVQRQVDNAPMYWLLNEQPTAAYGAASHWESRMQYLLLRGDGHTLIRRNAAGVITELVPLPWECVTPDRQSVELGSRLLYAVDDGYTVKGYDQDDVLHFPGFGFDGLRSMSVIQWAARNAAGNAMAMDEYSGRFFAAGAHPSVILSTDKKLTDDARTALQKAFASKYSGTQNAHRLPLVLTEGMKADAISISAQDAQLLDARRFQITDIARAFGVPPHLIGETSAATSWGSGIESMNRAFVQYTLEHHLVRIEQELNRKLFRTARFFVEFDRSALMDGDMKAQGEYFRAALGGPGSGKGWMSVNEIRRRKHLPPLAGQDEIFDPNVQTPAP